MVFRRRRDKKQQHTHSAHRSRSFWRCWKGCAVMWDNKWRMARRDTKSKNLPLANLVFDCWPTSGLSNAVTRERSCTYMWLRRALTQLLRVCDRQTNGVGNGNARSRTYTSTVRCINIHFVSSSVSCRSIIVMHIVSDHGNVRNHCAKR